MKSLQNICLITLLSSAFTVSVFGAEEWKALSRLDEAVAAIESLDPAGQRAKLSSLTEALDQVATRLAPKSFQENLVAHFLLGDMESVNKKLKKAETLSDRELTELTGSLHPLLETLLTEMKIPHTCRHAHHGHKGGHDHGHDH